ncbi:MAG: cytochrome c oxidase subunit 3 family protein, partial [Myxococcales bacterium]|nr:cytochrome c oxidase subunit 3 family protein [Myxococcales bacterium]
MASDAHSSADSHDAHPKFLAHHFDTPLQQFDAAKLGMWAFLAQEVLFFSGLFVFYGIYRSWYPEIFVYGSQLLDWKMGATNTVVLLFSSFTAAMAVRSAQVGEGGAFGGKAWTGRFIILTILCACAFMVIKYFEYSAKFHHGFLPGKYFAPNMAHVAHDYIDHHGHAITALPFEMRSFFGIYFMMTGVHGVHVLVGIGVFIWMYIRNAKGEFGPQFFTPIELTALYWHLVDLIWIYLFP